MHSADESHKQQLAERSEESEYETISQDEGLVSPTITPYTIDDDFPLSSPRPLKRTRSHKEPTIGRPTEQPKAAASASNSGEHSQEQVAHTEGSSHHQSEVATGPSSATPAGSTLSSTPSTHRDGGNRQENKDSTPKRSSVSQNTHDSLPNNQQAAMSPHARANLSQEMNFPAASGQQPMSYSRGSVNDQQQQQEGNHQHHMYIRIFIVQRRAPRYVSWYTDMSCIRYVQY